MTIAKRLIVPGVFAIAAVVGLAAGNSLNSTGASAATPGTTQSSTAADPADTPDQADPSEGGHVGSNGTKEAVLTGDAAAKAKAAAEAAVPGATVLRSENDAEDATYEVHMKKPDGSQVTVKLDGNFKVTGTESGNGSGGPGHQDQQD
jgi:hypothetical protein